MAQGMILRRSIAKDEFISNNGRTRRSTTTDGVTAAAVTTVSRKVYIIYKLKRDRNTSGWPSPR